MKFLWRNKSFIKLFFVLMCHVSLNPLYPQNSEDDKVCIKAGEEEYSNLYGYILPLYMIDDKTGSFKIARLRLYNRAFINDYISYCIQVDASNSVVLKDAYINLKFNDYVNLRIGQFIYNFGVFLEPWESPTIFGTELFSKLIGEPRDLGIKINGSLKKLRYYLILMNGTARGIADDDQKKTILVSFKYIPVSHLQIGASYYNGTRNFQNNESLISGADRNKSCIFLSYSNEKILFQFENIWSKDYIYQSNGFFLLFGYKLLNRTQPFFGYDFLNSGISLTQCSGFATGLNYYVNDRIFFKSILEFRKHADTTFGFERAAIELGVKFNMTSGS